jgi:hypothetical protein
MKKVLLGTLLFSALNTAQAVDQLATGLNNTGNNKINASNDEQKEHSISDYTSNNIRVGAFTIAPKLTQGNEYSSNIYYRDSYYGKTDSYIAHFKPGVAAASNWNRHSLKLLVDTDFALYATQGDHNDYNHVMTKLDGRFDVLKDSHFDGTFGYNYLTETRGSPDQIAGLNPTIYSTYVIDGFYTHTLNRMNIKAGTNAIRYDYQNVLTSLGTSLQMDTRNRWEYAPEIRIGYLIQPEYEAFAKLQYIKADYDTLTLTNGSGPAYDRNSQGYNALAGLAFDMTGLITGDVSMGYIERYYQSSVFQTVAGVNGLLNLKWRPTALTTVSAKISRTINETTQAGVAGVFAVGTGLKIEHELRRNLNLFVAGDYANSAYQGFQEGTTSTTNQYDRNDNNYSTDVGAKYMLNRNFSADMSYRYQNRTSNYTYNGYDVNAVYFNLTGKY